MGERSPGRTRDNLGRNRTFPKSKTPGACPYRGSHALWMSAGRGVRRVGRGFSDRDYRGLGDVGCPFEPKASDWGRLDGMLVAVDYSNMDP